MLDRALFLKREGGDRNISMAADLEQRAKQFKQRALDKGEGAAVAELAHQWDEALLKELGRMRPNDVAQQAQQRADASQAMPTAPLPGQAPGQPDVHKARAEIERRLRAIEQQGQQEEPTHASRGREEAVATALGVMLPKKSAGSDGGDNVASAQEPSQKKQQVDKKKKKKKNKKKTVYRPRREKLDPLPEWSAAAAFARAEEALECLYGENKLRRGRFVELVARASSNEKQTEQQQQEQQQERAKPSPAKRQRRERRKGGGASEEGGAASPSPSAAPAAGPERDDEQRAETDDGDDSSEDDDDDDDDGLEPLATVRVVWTPQHIHAHVEQRRGALLAKLRDLQSLARVAGTLAELPPPPLRGGPSGAANDPSPSNDKGRRQYGTRPYD